MRTQPKITLQLVAPLTLAGCIEQAYQAGVGLAPMATGTSATSTGEPGKPTTSSDGSGSVQTVTGAEPTSPGGEGSSPGDETSMGANLDLPMNDPPEIESFTADPPHMSEAGTSWLKLKASDDVVLVRLRLNGQQIFEGPPAKFPYAYDVLSTSTSKLWAKSRTPRASWTRHPPRSRSNSRRQEPKNACFRTWAHRPA